MLLYALIGATGAAIDFCLFLMLSSTAGVPPLLANLVSVSVGITNNFALNVLFNFRVSTRLWQRFALFYGTGFVGLVGSEAILVAGISLFELTAETSKVVSIPIVVALQYVANRFMAFGKLVETR